MPEKKIAGTEYRVELLGAKDAYALLAKLLLLAGSAGPHLPGILALSGSEKHEATDATNLATLKAVSGILQAHGAEAFVDLKTSMIELAQAKRPSGIYEQVDLDVDFAGDLESSEKLFDFVMEVQFGNFSKGPNLNGPIALAMQTVRTLFLLTKDAK